jgi:DNA-binding transcriptional MocR family regulator
MTKKEIVWREILVRAIEKKETNFTQKEISQKYNLSLSTVFSALKIPRQNGSLKGRRGFSVTDTEKLLYLWATFRNLKKDIIYQTSVDKNILAIESEIPPNAIFAAYSAFRQKYSPLPADYDRAYFYLKESDLNIIKNRFPKKNGYQNLIILKADPWLEKFGQAVPDCQIFADLWNLPEWYAKDFLTALKEKIFKQF